MEYITAKQFLEQPKEIQDVFKKYFEGNFGLYEDITGTIQYGYLTKDRVELLTERQLRKFIEDKIGGKIDSTYWDNGYEICVFKKEMGDELIKNFDTDKTDLLQAYWEVACRIALKELGDDNN